MRVSLAETSYSFLPLTLITTSPVAVAGNLTVNVTSSLTVIFSAGSTITSIEGTAFVIVIVADFVTLLWFSSTFVVTVKVYLPTSNNGKVILSPDTFTSILSLFSSIKVAIISPVEFTVTALMTASVA